MHRPFARAALAVVIASTSFAHAADETVVVVTATRQIQRANDLVTDVAIIDREQIDDSTAETVGELLSRQPGVEMNRTGGAGTPESIYIRGANSDHTLVLIDGVRINSATLGATSIEMIPLSQIERIEILRGAASAIYGADALGGVIQIFTRNANEPGTQLGVGYGSRGTYEANLNHQAASGAWKYGISVGASGSHGINQIQNASSAYFNPDKDGYRNKNFSANVSYRFHSGEAGFRSFHSETNNRYDTATMDAFWNYIMAGENWKMWHKVSSNSLWMKNDIARNWKSTLSFSEGIDDTRSTPSSILGQEADAFKTRSRQVAWQNDFILPVGTGLLAFEELEQSIASTSSFTQKSRKISSLLAGWNGNIGRHSFQANFRTDHNTQFGNKGTRTLGYAYRLTDSLKLSAMTGTGFKAPTFNQLYFPATPGVGMGNPNLVPESSKSKEVRLTFNTRRADASLAYFHNRISDLINWGDAPPPFFTMPTNIGSATIFGWEGAANLHLGAWSVGGSLTLQNPENDATGRQLNRRAERHGLVYVSTRIEGWKLRLEATGTSHTYDDVANTRRLNGYGLVNLYADRKLNPALTFFARASNIFDKEYLVARSSSGPFMDNSVYPGVGASLLVGLRYASK